MNTNNDVKLTPEEEEIFKVTLERDVPVHKERSTDKFHEPVVKSEFWDDNIAKKLSHIGLTENRMIVKNLTPDEVRSKSGLITTVATTEKKYRDCMIYVTGPGKLDLYNNMLVPMVLQPGHIVSIMKVASQQITIDREELYILKEGDVVLYSTNGKLPIIS